MTFQDLIITPFYLIFFSGLAYVIRPYVTTPETRKYFLPALWVRFAGAIFLGIIYQFYYDGGDTYNYFDQAGIVYEALIKEPMVGIRLLSGGNNYLPETFSYASRIYWFRSESEFFVIRLVALLSVLTGHTYTSISLFFAAFSFTGSWMIFKVLTEKFPGLSFLLAIGTLFVPSTIFWGSGIMKDTLTLSATCFAFWAGFQIIEKRNFSFLNVAILVFACWLLFSIKMYILICLLPALFVWLYLKNINAIKHPILRYSAAPFILVLSFSLGFFLLQEITESSQRYNLDSLARWTMITAYDIRFWTGRDAGSGYSLGEQDGTWLTLVKLAPAGINVTLFRPYLWEIRNPLMAFAGIEAFFVIVLTIASLFRFSFAIIKKPVIAFLLIFSLTFAFAVGVSTYNFGTLNRYKIPAMPFFVSSVLILYSRPTKIN